MVNPIIRILRNAARCAGRLFTLAFALFAATSGLLEGNTWAAERSFKVQVIDRHSLKTIQGIQVILKDALFPVYGTTSATSQPSAGRSIDTVVTGANGIAAFTNVKTDFVMNKAFFEMSDIDGPVNGSYLKKQILSTIDDTTKLNLLSDGADYTVRGKVKAYLNHDSVPLPNIKIVLSLSGRFRKPDCNAPSTFDDYCYENLIIPVDSVFSKEDGRFSCALKQVYGAIVVNAYDVDGLSGSGYFISSSMQPIDPVNNADPVLISMSIAPFESAKSEYQSGLQLPQHYTYSKGIVSIGDMHDIGKQLHVEIYNANGVLIQRLFDDGSGVFNWNTSGRPSGSYFMSIMSNNQRNTMKVIVP